MDESAVLRELYDAAIEQRDTWRTITYALAGTIVTLAGALWAFFRAQLHRAEKRVEALEGLVTQMRSDE